MEISIFNFFSRYVPEEPKIEFVDIDFFPEKKYQLFDEVKPSLEKILNALKEKCAGFNIFFDEEELRTLGMMTGKLIRPERFFKVGCVFPMVVVSMLPRTEFGRNDHWKDASHFRNA